MVIANPREGVSTLARSLPYAAPASSGNRLAAPAPATRPLPRPAPQSELRAVLRSPAAAGLLASDAAVLGALWLHRNASAIAWPSTQTLAELAHVSRRTTFSALARLERAGLIVRRAPSLVARRRRQSTTYTIPAAPPTLDPHAARAPRAAAPVAPVAHVEPSKPAQPGATAALVHVQRLHPKDHSEETQTQNARADAHARAATAPPGDRLGPPAAAPSSPEVTPATVEPSPPEALPSTRRTRAERAAANRAAWAARTRPASTAARATTPRRAPAYRAPVERVPDPRDALAALREWRSTLPALGRETDRESATPAPVPGVRRPDLAQRAPVALSGLLEAFARVPLGPHGGQHGETPAPPDGARHLGAGLDRALEGQRRGAAAPSGPRVEERAPPLWSPHPRR